MNTISLKEKVNELANRQWNLPEVEKNYKLLKDKGIPQKAFKVSEILKNKQQILNRVQRRAEEYNALTGNCARGTAMALLEEFGLGDMTVVTALSSFPGFGGTGWMCGGVTGSLVALGLYFGSDDLLNGEAVGSTMAASRVFMERFIEITGSPLCPEIQEKVVFGKYMDAGASPENMEKFAKDKGFEKCGLLPGIGARLAAEIIIDSFN